MHSAWQSRLVGDVGITDSGYHRQQLWFLRVHISRKRSGRFSVHPESFDPTDVMTGPLHGEVGPTGHSWGGHICGALHRQQMDRFLLRTISEAYRPLVDIPETFQLKRFECAAMNRPQLSAVGTHDDRRDLHIVFWADEHKTH